MDHHLASEEAGNSRNGYGRKTVTTDSGKLDLAIPRDREGTFDPQLIAKYQRRFPGFDEKIVSMYARGMSTREIVGHLHDLYGIDVSPDLISAVTDAVLDEIAAWQARPLDPVYPLVSSMPCGSGSATKGWSGTRPFTSPWASAPTAPRRYWASGSSRTRVPGSGSG